MFPTLGPRGRRWPARARRRSGRCARGCRRAGRRLGSCSASGVSITRCSSLCMMTVASGRSGQTTRGGSTGSAATALWPRSRQRRSRPGLLITRLRTTAACRKSRSGHRCTVWASLEHARAGAALAIGMPSVKGKRRRAAGDEPRRPATPRRSKWSRKASAGLHCNVACRLARRKLARLNLAVVGVQSARRHVREAGDQAIKFSGLRARANSTAAHADIEIEQQINLTLGVAAGL